MCQGITPLATEKDRKIALATKKAPEMNSGAHEQEGIKGLIRVECALAFVVQWAQWSRESETWWLISWCCSLELQPVSFRAA